MLRLAVWLQSALELNPLGPLGGELAATTKEVDFCLNPSSFQKVFNNLLTGIPIS